MNSTIKSTKKNNSQFVDFHAMYSKLPSLLSAQMSSSISVPICFVCLLHLANEKVCSSFACMWCIVPVTVIVYPLSIYRSLNSKP